MSLWSQWWVRRRVRLIEVLDTAPLPGGAFLHIVRLGDRTVALIPAVYRASDL